jgi:hypothetical protein
MSVKRKARVSVDKGYAIVELKGTKTTTTSGVPRERSLCKSTVQPAIK